MAAKTCSICGKPSGMYPLCTACFKLRDEGKVIQCPDCKMWHKTSDNHECNNSEKMKKIEEKSEQIPEKAQWLKNKTEEREQFSEKSVCKKCGQPSGKYDICYDCFRKKTDEDLKRDIESLIESEKDSGVDVRKRWPAKIRTKNGLPVRSHAECRIADWLSSKNIIFEYETMVLSKNDVNRFLLTDFYIPQAKVYIEYWGYKDKETYNKRRNEKKIIYDERGLTMLDLEDNHLEVLDDAMKQLLEPYLSDSLKNSLY